MVSSNDLMQGVLGRHPDRNAQRLSQHIGKVRRELSDSGVPPDAIDRHLACLIVMEPFVKKLDSLAGASIRRDQAYIEVEEAHREVENRLAMLLDVTLEREYREQVSAKEDGGDGGPRLVRVGNR